MRVLIEDSIMQKGRAMTAGSRMLEGIIAAIESTAAARLRARGYELAQFTSPDEFALGGAVSVDAIVRELENDEVHFALFCDMSGEKLRALASAGLCVLKPSFGAVSRLGVIPVMSSADVICAAAETPKICAEALRAIAGRDGGDGLSMDISPEDVSGDIKVKKLDEDAVPYSGLYADVLEIIRAAEFMGNASRYDGMRYGHRADATHGVDDIYTRSRTEGFGTRAKLAIVTGEFVLSAEQLDGYYDRAMRARRLLSESFAGLFGDCRVIELRGGELAETAALLLGLPLLRINGRALIAGSGDDMALFAAAERGE